MERKLTWNFLIDSGLQEQIATPVSWYKSILPDSNKKIQELTKVEESPSDQNIRTKDKFFEDMSTVQEREWVSDEEALELVQNYYKEKWYTIEWIDFEETQEIEEPIIKEEEWLISKWLQEVGQIQSNILWGAISKLPEITSNLGGFFIGKPIDTLIEKAWFDVNSLEEQFKKDWINTKQDFQEFFWTNPEDFTTSVSEFWTEVWTLFVPWGQAKLIQKFPQAADKIRKLWTVVWKAAEKAPQTFNLLKSALIWAWEVGKFEILTEWDVTKEWLAIWAVANPLIWKSIEKIWTISKWLADKLEVMGLLNPAKLNKVAEQLKTKWVENLSVSEYLLKKNIKWSKESIVKQLEWLAKKSKWAVDKGINSVEWLYKNSSVDEILQFLRKDLSEIPWQDKVVNRISELFTKSNKWEWLKLSEINEVKRIADSQLNLFTIAWDVREWATKQGLTNLRWDIQKFIENTAAEKWVKNIKQLNKETQVNKTLIDAINRKDSADQARELLTAFAPGGVWALWGAFAPSADPFDTLKNIVIWGAVWQVAWSTTIKTNLANIINKLSWLQKKELTEFISSKGATPISSELINLITE